MPNVPAPCGKRVGKIHIGHQVVEMESPHKQVSVIIPVHRDWDRLDSCVACLERQTLARVCFEIIVVSNESDREGLEAHERDLGARGVICVHEPRGYSYAARNAGIERAQGDILAFTDADCLPDRAWLENATRRLSSGAVDLIGGRIEMVGDANTAAADYDRIYGLSQERFLAEHEGFATANVVVKRHVVEALNGFDAALRSGGDFDFCRRAQALGFVLNYEAGATVRHPVRASLSELLDKSVRVVGGALDQRRQLSAAQREPLGAFWWRRLRPPIRSWFRIVTGSELRTAQLSVARRLRLVLLQNALYLHRIFALAWLSLRPGEKVPTQNSEG